MIHQQVAGIAENQWEEQPREIFEGHLKKSSVAFAASLLGIWTNSIVVRCSRVRIRWFVHVFVLRYETVPGFIGRTLNEGEDDDRAMTAEK